MDWIANNKEWLLSGVLISVPLAVIGWFIVTRRNRQSQRGGDNSTNVQVGGDIKVGNGKSDD